MEVTALCGAETCQSRGPLKLFREEVLSENLRSRAIRLKTESRCSVELSIR